MFPLNATKIHIKAKLFAFRGVLCAGLTLNLGTTSEIFKSLISSSCPTAFEIRGKKLLALIPRKWTGSPANAWRNLEGFFPQNTATIKLHFHINLINYCLLHFHIISYPKAIYRRTHLICTLFKLRCFFFLSLSTDEKRCNNFISLVPIKVHLKKNQFVHSLKHLQ